MPTEVVRQPATRIKEEGHSTYITSVWPAFRIPETPNQRRTKMAPATNSPTVAPNTAIDLVPITDVSL